MFKSERFQVGFQSSAYPQAQPGLLRADNVDFTQPGVARLRDGDEPLSMDIANTSPVEQVASEAHAIWHRGEELCIVDGRGSLYSYNRCEETWQRAGNWTPARLRQQPLLSARNGFRQCDAQTLGDCTLIVGEDAGAVSFAVVTLGGQVLVPPTQIAALGQDIRCAKADDFVLIAYTPGFGGIPSTDLELAVWEPTNVDTVTPVATVPAAFHLMPGLTFPPLYDLRRTPDANRIAVLFASAVNSLFSVEFDKTGAGSSASLYAVGGTDIRAVSIYPLPGSTYRVAWWDDGAQTVNSALLTPGVIVEQASAAVVLDDSTTYAAAYGIAVAVSPTAAEPTRAVVISDSTYTGGGLGTMHKIDVWETFGVTMTRSDYRWHGILQSMAWARPGQVFAALALDQDTATSPLYVFNQLENHIMSVWEFENMQVVSRGMRGYAIPGQAITQDPVTPDEFDDMVRVPTPRLETTVLAFGGSPEITKYVYAQDIDFTPRAQSAALLNTVSHAAHAGFIRAYDGYTASEHDWHCLPDIQQVTTSNLGNLVAAGTYTVALTWEWVNNRSDVHRSAPVLFPITMAAGQNLITFQVRVPWTERQNVRLIAWRSLNGDASVLYRETASDVNIAARFVSITVARADIDAEREQPLDQQPAGTVLAHDPTPGTDFCAVVQGRLWTRDPERGWIVRYSLPPYEGFAVGWNSLQGIELQGQKDATAVAEQDGQIMLFTRDGAYVIVGNGPEINGGGQQFSVPQVVPLDTGALNQEGVVKLATGIAYTSPTEGIRVLARTRTGGDLGALVERLFLEHGQVVAMAVFDPDTGEMFALDNAAEGGIRGTLRLHLGTGRWSRDIGRQGHDMSLGSQRELVIVRLDGTVIRRVAGRVVDPDGAAMTMYIRPPWGRHPDSHLQPCFDGIQAQVTGSYIGAHRIETRLYRDYQSTPSVDGYIDVAAPPSDYSYRHEWALSNTALRSMGVEVQVTANGSKGVEIVAIDQEMVPAGQSAGPLPAERLDWTPNP